MNLEEIEDTISNIKANKHTRAEIKKLVEETVPELCAEVRRIQNDFNVIKAALEGEEKYRWELHDRVGELEKENKELKKELQELRTSKALQTTGLVGDKSMLEAENKRLQEKNKQLQEENHIFRKQRLELAKKCRDLGDVARATKTAGEILEIFERTYGVVEGYPLGEDESGS